MPLQVMKCTLPSVGHPALDTGCSSTHSWVKWEPLWSTVLLRAKAWMKIIWKISSNQSIILIQFGNVFWNYIILEYVNIVLTLNGNGTKLHYRGFSLDIRKSFFTTREVVKDLFQEEHWNRLPSQMFDVPNPLLFKKLLDNGLNAINF